MKILRIAAALVLAVGLGACTAASDAYVAQWSGYSVMRGNIVSVENMSGSELQRLGDGIAVKINKPGCKITMQFENERASSMELGPGVIVVYGLQSDYILRSAPGVPAR